MKGNGLFAVVLSAALLVSGCGSISDGGASGGFLGAELGSILGSAIGGISGGPRGSDVGTIVGMAGGAVIGAVVGDAVLADEAGAVYGEDDGEIRYGDVVDDVVVGALQEGRHHAARLDLCQRQRLGGHAVYRRRDLLLPDLSHPHR